MASSMSKTPRLLSLSTSVPAIVLDQDDIKARARSVFARRPEDFERLLPAFANAGIERRHSCVPLDWHEAEHGWAERNRLYIDNSVALLEEAARDCIAKAGLRAEDIGGIVSVSTTGIATPSLDALLMERLSLRRDVRRLPIFGLGCVGGVIGLARAAALALSAPDEPVLFTVVELCSLTFRKTDQSKSNIIASALFGDGAAAAILGAGEGPALAAWGEHTWPNSLDVMGWSVEDDGFGVLFSRDIPTLVRQQMRPAVDAFLAKNKLCLSDIDNFVCHPGGTKVIAALEEAFAVKPGTLDVARSVLRDYGNMSAATVFFVLEKMLRSGLGRRSLLSAMGPGFTAGFLTLESP